MASSSDDHLFWTWAELKFIYHERMILFYSTFVALKRQDSAGLPVALIEDPRDMEEELLFSGVIRDREMYHVLRLQQDRGSRVVRLEARSYRGDRDEVPIWTTFLTKYKDEGDRDIFNLESHGVVSMICPKPKPYIFVPEYGLPMMSNGDLALQFVDRDGEFDDRYHIKSSCRMLMGSFLGQTQHTSWRFGRGFALLGGGLERLDETCVCSSAERGVGRIGDGDTLQQKLCDDDSLIAHVLLP